MCLDNTSLKACKINASILLGDKCLQSQLVLSFTRADLPRVASPCIVCFWNFILLSFFLPVVDDDFFLFFGAENFGENHEIYQEL